MITATHVRTCLLLLTCSWLMTACVTVPAESESAATPAVTFTNTFWRLVHVGGDKVAVADGEEIPHIIFLDDGRVSGFAGCNRFAGAYGMVEGQFRFTEMAATRDICPGETIEPAFMKAMRQTLAAEMDDDELLLLNGKGQPLAVFKARKKTFDPQ